VTAGRIVVWRHGRTEWNATGRFQGQADVPLDELGRLQALQAAEVLAALGPIRIVSSDLSRASETAAVLASHCGLAVETDARLREIHVGSWEGLTVSEVQAVDPDLARRYLAGEDVPRSSTGETVTQTAERVSTVLAEVGESAPDGSVVVVATHGVAGRVGACRLVGMPSEAWRLLGGLHNCGWIRIDRHRHGYWRIGEYNVAARPPSTHAEGPGS
jgi:glucosyl-3-phosphoglycerate phosphatase